MRRGSDACIKPETHTHHHQAHRIDPMSRQEPTPLQLVNCGGRSSSYGEQSSCMIGTRTAAWTSDPEA